MSQPHVRARLDFAAGCSLGPGKIALLEAIASAGSLTAAARTTGMSYRRAWLLLHDVNESFVEPVVELTVGGKEGGGARLTAFGSGLIARFREFEREVSRLAGEVFSGVEPAAAPASPRVSRKRPLSRH